MRRQKRQQGILQIGEVERLVVDRHLVGGQVDRHVAHGDELGSGPLAARPQKLAHARGAFGLGRLVDHEVALHLHGQAKIGQRVLRHHEQGAHAALPRQQLLELGRRVVMFGMRFVNHQVVVVLMRGRLLELRRRKRSHVDVHIGQNMLKLVCVVQAIRHENYLFTFHSSLPAGHRAPAHQGLQHFELTVDLPLRHLQQEFLPFAGLRFDQVFVDMLP